MPKEKVSQVLAKSIINLIPTFGLFAVGGCLVGYLFFHAPLNELGTLVAVPLIVTFLVSRILVLTVPKRVMTTPPLPMPSTRSLLVAIPVFLCIMGTLIFGVSALLYEVIGFAAIGKQAGECAILAALLGASALLFFLAAAWAASKRLDERLKLMVLRQEEIFWEVVGAPKEISALFIGFFHGHTQ